MSKAAQLYGCKPHNGQKLHFASHTHTHTIKIGEVRTNRVKTGYGRGPSVYGWPGTAWKGPRGQCMDGTCSMSGNHNSIMYYMGGDNYGRGLYNSMGIAQTKPTNYPCQTCWCHDQGSLLIYSQEGRFRLWKEQEFVLPRKTRICEVLRTVKICKNKPCETSGRDHTNCTRYERPHPLCQIWETTPIVPGTRQPCHAV